MLVLSRKLNESIIIDGLIEIKVVDVGITTVKIGIEAPRRFHILRKEIYDLVSQENKEATESKGSSVLEQLRKKHDEE